MEWTVVATLVTACSSILLAAITAYYAWLLRQQLRTEHAPHVIVRLGLLTPKATYECLVIENIGNRPAFDVEFAAAGVTLTENGESFRQGLLSAISSTSVIAPGERRAYLLGRAEELRQWMADRDIHITTAFSRTPGATKGRMSTQSVLQARTTGKQLLMPPGEDRELDHMASELRDAIRKLTQAVETVGDSLTATTRI